MSKIQFGFLDESGILEKKARTGESFVISVLLVGDPSEIKRVIKYAHGRAKGKYKTHRVFKASKEDPGFVKLVLEELAKKNIHIIIGRWSKSQKSAHQDKNLLYAHLVAQTVNITLSEYPRLNLVVHKRYTSPEVRNQITDIIGQAVKRGNFLSISHRTEVECRELELADAVAWAVYQKYNNKNQIFYNIIKEKILKENRLAA